MPSARDFLERLRPSGTPGAPSASGVPADRATERTAELEAVFARLVDVQEEADRIRTAAAAEARRRRESAGERAAAIVAEARRSVDAQRAAAAAAGHAEAQARAHEIIADARAVAATVTRDARLRQPDLVDLVVRNARIELSGLLTDAP